MNTHQGSRVLGHDRHPQLHHGTMRTFVAKLARTTCQQRGDVTFHHRATITTGASQLHLVRSPFPVPTRFVEQVPKVGGAWLRVDRLHRLGDTDTEKPPVVERLAQGRVIAPKSPRDRVDGGRRWPTNPCASVLDLVHQRDDRAGSRGIAHGDSTGEDKACRWL